MTRVVQPSRTDAALEAQAAAAVGLGRLFGNSPQFWLNLQAEYDVAKLSQAMRKELDRIPRSTPREVLL